MRIKGIGQEYSDLLQAAGVDTVKELKYRNPGKLAEADGVRQCQAQARPRDALPAPSSAGSSRPSGFSSRLLYR